METTHRTRTMAIDIAIDIATHLDDSQFADINDVAEFDVAAGVWLAVDPVPHVSVAFGDDPENLEFVNVALDGEDLGDS